MTTSIRCSVCGGTFSSSEDYQSHLPCHGSGQTFGGAGQYAKEGTGRP